jgi:hypothetical protein
VAVDGQTRRRHPRRTVAEVRSEDEEICHLRSQLLTEARIAADILRSMIANCDCLGYGPDVARLTEALRTVEAIRDEDG